MRDSSLRSKDLLLEERPVSYQLVGGVMATKAMTGRGCESMIPNIGTETLPKHLRVAAVENLRQWAKA